MTDDAHSPRLSRRPPRVFFFTFSSGGGSIDGGSIAATLLHNGVAPSHRSALHAIVFSPHAEVSWCAEV